MRKLRVVLCHGLFFCLFWCSFAFAVPDPRDSIIVESKTVTLGIDTGIISVKVYITNKDTLAALSIAFNAKSLTSGAYMKLARPRDIGSAVRPLDSSLQQWRIYSGMAYNDAAPDTIIAGFFWDPTDPSTVEPPNLARKAFLELRFDSVFLNANATTGVMELDSAIVIRKGTVNTGYSGLHIQANGSRSIPINFLKGRITINRPTQPCNDLNSDESFTAADIVVALNCVFLGEGSYGAIFTPADVVRLLYLLFSGPTPSPLIPPVPCE